MSYASRERIQLAIAVLLLVAADSVAEEESDDDYFDIPVAEVEGLSGGAALDVDDAPFTGNPLSSLVANWPPDLVVAPIPGRSPPASTRRSSSPTPVSSSGTRRS